MPKYLTSDEVKDLRRKGKIPYSVPKPAAKDPSVQAIEGIGKALSDHLKVQERESSTLIEEMKAVLEVVKLSDGRSVKVDLSAMPAIKEWEEIDLTVTERDRQDLIYKVKLKKVK